MVGGLIQNLLLGKKFIVYLQRLWHIAIAKMDDGRSPKEGS